MKVSSKKLAQIVFDKLERGQSPANVAKALASYLVANRRSGDLDAITRSLLVLRENTGIVEINAASRHEISESIKKAVSKLFDAKKTVFNETIDPSLISGARFESASKRLDVSAIRRLNLLKKASTS